MTNSVSEHPGVDRLSVYCLAGLVAILPVEILGTISPTALELLKFILIATLLVRLYTTGQLSVKRRTDPFLWFWMAFLGLGLVELPFAVSRFTSAEKWIGYLFTVGVYLVATRLLRDKAGRSAVITALTWGAVVSSVVAVGEWLFGYGIIGTPPEVRPELLGLQSALGWRAQGLMNGPDALGAFLAFASIVVLFSFPQDASPRQTNLRQGFLILTALGTAATQSRGAIASYVFTMIVLSLVRRRTARVYLLAAALASVFVWAPFVVPPVQHIGSAVVARLESHPNTGTTTAGAASSGTNVRTASTTAAASAASSGIAKVAVHVVTVGVRNALWRAGLEVAIHRRIVGIGLDGWRTEATRLGLPPGLRAIHLHNQLLTTWVELGPAGLLLYLGLWLIILALAWQRVHAKMWDLQAGVLLATIGMGIHGLVDAGMVIGTSSLSLLVWTFLGLLAPEVSALLGRRTP